VEGSSDSDWLKALATTFASQISWVKASPSCRYRFDVVGVVSFQSSQHITAHEHEFYEVGLCLAGNGRLSIARESKSISSGDLFVIQPGKVHSLKASADSDLSIFLFRVNIEGDHVLQLSDWASGLSQNALVKAGKLLQLIRSWAELRVIELSDTVSLSLFSRYLAFEMLALLGSMQSRKDPASLVEKAKLHIEQNLSRKIEVRDLADYVGVSERTIRRHFRSELAISVIDYVSQRRIDRAERYLALHWSVADVAREVGFETSGQLSRLFQKVKGVTPKAWQQAVAPTKRLPRI